MPGEMDDVGEIRVAAYLAGGFLSADSGYASTLRGLGTDGSGHVLVAVLPAAGESGESGADGEDGCDGAPGADGEPGKDGDDRVGGDMPAWLGPAERVVGTVMLQTWPDAGPVVAGPHEAEIRALAVRPGIQGRGIGRELLRQVISRAAGVGVDHLVLCTEPEMRAAHHLYEQAGFVRLPERDWKPVPEVTLLVYGLDLVAPARQIG